MDVLFLHMATDMEFRFTCARVELLLHSLVYS